MVGGGSTYLFLVALPQTPSAAATTYIDTIADGSLGAAAPSLNTASSKQVVQGTTIITKPSCVSVATALTATPGGAQVGALQITAYINIVSVVASANDSCMLPEIYADNVGLMVAIRNNGANDMRVYPSVGKQINGAGANVPFVLPASASANFISVSATEWIIPYTVG